MQLHIKNNRFITTINKSSVFLNKKHSNIVILSFLLFLLIYAVNAFFNYEIKMAGDEYQYLQYTKTLLSGKLDYEHSIYSLLKEAFPDINSSCSYFPVNNSGKLVSWYSIGISFVFAPFVALFGNNVFYIAPIIFDIIMLASLFLLVFLFMKNRNDRYALISALVAVAVFGTVINFRLGIRRDHFCATMVIFLSLLVFKAIRTKKWHLWHIGSAIISFLTIVKVNFLLLYIPFFIVLLHSMSHDLKDWRVVLRHLLLGTAVAFVIFLPFFIHNYIGTGNCFVPTQLTEARSFTLGHGENFNKVGKLISNIVLILKAQSYIYAVNGTPRWTACIYLCVVIIGIWIERKSPFVIYWLLPIIILFYGFYSTTTRRPFIYNTYLMPVYPITAFFFASGLTSFFRRINKGIIAYLVFALMIMMPYIALKSYRILPGKRHNHFQVPDAVQLVGDLKAVIPSGAVLLCDKFLSLTIDYFSDIYCFPAMFLKTKNDDGAAKVSYLLEKGVSVFFCDFEGINYSAYYKEYLSRHFNMKLVKNNQQLYKFPKANECQTISIYRIIRFEKSRAPERKGWPKGNEKST